MSNPMGKLQEARRLVLLMLEHEAVYGAGYYWRKPWRSAHSELAALFDVDRKASRSEMLARIAEIRSMGDGA
jgi:hypothetical protein